MRRLLLDTCTFIWLGSAPAKLGKEAARLLDDPDSELWLSDASILEICLKWRAAKLTLPAPPRIWVEEQAAAWQLLRLPLESEHSYRITELPELHKDPFDRLLVAQAITGNFTLVTPDPAIRAYPVAVAW